MSAHPPRARPRDTARGARGSRFETAYRIRATGSGFETGIRGGHPARTVPRTSAARTLTRRDVVGYARRVTYPPRLPLARRFVAVDWSGALADGHRRTWLAEARAPTLARPDVILRLENGRPREALVLHLVELARRDPRLVVGLDFAFSFPEWFLRHHGVADGPAAWDLVARRGERWLARDAPPFWGRPGVPRPPLDPSRPAWRATEGETTRQHGIAPKTVFQVGGAGSVGTGSLRGMPHLAALRAAGFAVWPFDAPRLPLVVEIYPRDLTGRVTKSSRIARALHVQRHLACETRAVQDAATSSEDAFDAACSAAAMARHAREFTRLAPARDERERREGRIWRPLRDPLFPAAPPAPRPRVRVPSGPRAPSAGRPPTGDGALPGTRKLS